MGLSAPLSLQIVPDTVPPTIIAATPANGEMVFKGLTALQISFSESMDAGTLNSSNFQLLNSAEQILAPSTFGVFSDDRVLRFSTGELPSGNYRLLVHAAAVTDRAGNALAAGDQLFRFVVAPFRLDEVTIRSTNRLDNQWTNVMNWQPHRLPTAGDNVFIGNAPAFGDLVLPNSFDYPSSTNVQRRGFGVIRFSNLVSRLPLHFFVTAVEAEGTILVDTNFDLTSCWLNGGTLLVGPNTRLLGTGNGLHSIWNGVTVTGDLVGTNRLYAAVTNGLAIYGTVNGGYQFNFSGTNTLSGNAVFQDNTFRIGLESPYPPSILVISSNITLRGKATIYPRFGDSVINYGTIRADFPYHFPAIGESQPRLQIQLGVPGKFINYGLIEATNSGQIYMVTSDHQDVWPIAFGVSTFINQGTLRSTGGGTLSFNNLTFMSPLTFCGAGSTNVFNCEVKTEPGRISTLSGAGTWLIYPGNTFIGGSAILSDGAVLTPGYP